LRIKIKGLSPRPTIVNNIPPIYSHFHARISIASKIKDGIRCIKKPLICCQIVSSDEKASVANILIKIIAKIHVTLGSQ